MVGEARGSLVYGTAAAAVALSARKTLVSPYGPGASAVLALLLPWLLFRAVRPWLRDAASLKGQAVLITGCDHGFGAAVALTLAAHGTVVFAGVLNEDSGRRLLERQKQQGAAKGAPEPLRPLVLDVTKDADVAAAVLAVEKSGVPLRGIVNNAAISAFGFAELVPMERFRQNMEVNHLGTIRVCQAFLPVLRARRGRVVNVGSVGGRMPSAFGSAYLSTKAAMMSFSESLRQEVHRFGVRVCLVEPGFFRTELLAHGSQNGATSADAVAKATEKQSESVTGPAAAYPAYAKKMEDTAKPIQLLETLNGGTEGIGKVVDCVVDALANRQPLPYYVVGYDGFVLRNVVAPVCPAWIVDWAQTLAG